MATFISKKIDFRSTTKSKAVYLVNERERESKIRSITKILEIRKITSSILESGFDNKVEDFEVLVELQRINFINSKKQTLQINKKWLNANTIYWNKTLHSKNLFKNFVGTMIEMKDKQDTSQYAESNLRLLKEFINQQNSAIKRKEKNALIVPTKKKKLSLKSTPKKRPQENIISRLRKRKHRSNYKNNHEGTSDNFDYLDATSNNLKRKKGIFRDPTFAEFFDYDKRVKEIEVSLKLVDSLDTTFHTTIPVEKLVDYLKSQILSKIQQEKMKVKKNLSFKKSDAINAIKNIRKNFESFILKNSTMSEINLNNSS